MALVALGGFFGAAGRDAIAQALPTARTGFPSATLAVNISGAFALGLLLAALARSGPSRLSHRARLAFGTGFLGAFTTYSTFVLESDLLVRDGRLVTAGLYVAVTVMGGVPATLGGLALGRRSGARPQPLEADAPVSATAQGR
jgi:fluoride exporter